MLDVIAHRIHKVCDPRAGHFVIAVLCLAVLQRCSSQDARISSTINDQIESLRLAQSYTNVTSLLNEVVATANSGTNNLLGTDFPKQPQTALSHHLYFHLRSEIPGLAAAKPLHNTSHVSWHSVPASVVLMMTRVHCVCRYPH